MQTKKASIAGAPPHRASAGRPRPRLVVARGNSAGARKGTTPAESILIVEDDYLVASQVEGALQEAGFAIAGVAGSAAEAVQLATAERPALVVMDIRLSGERDGIDAALELFTKHGIRCILATAHQTPDTRARARAAKPLAWLPKPYTMPSLVEAVRTALRDLQSNEG